jgi:hypothetical protein
MALSVRLTKRDAGAVVTKYFDEIPFDFASAESGLLNTTRDFGFAVPVFEAEDGRRYVGDIGIESSLHTKVQQAMMLRFGRSIRGPSVTRTPLSWEHQGSAQLFPTLTGQLELAAAVGGRSRLTLSIEYAPPPGTPDGAVDKGMTYRVAWVTLNDIETRIAASLGRLIRKPASVPGSQGPLLEGSGPPARLARSS